MMPLRWDLLLILIQPFTQVWKISSQMHLQILFSDMEQFFQDHWIFGQWEHGFMEGSKPSIEFLELFALCGAILTWSDLLQKTRIIIHCDNQSVVHMVNSQALKCMQCMKLIRIITLDNLRKDRRIFVWHVEGKNNSLSDSLSCLNLKRFFKLAPSSVNKELDRIPTSIWPLSKIWNSDVVT